MGQCRLCGEKAGLLKSLHSDCASRHDTAIEDIQLTVATAAISRGHGVNLPVRLQQIAEGSFVTDLQIDSAAAEGWTIALKRVLDDHLLAPEEDRALAETADQLDLDQSKLGDGWTRLMLARTLREIGDGHYPSVNLKVDGYVPFNFQKNERLLWLFPDTDYYKQTTKRSYSGSST